MDIELICVGKLKEKYLKAGIQEYQKRLQPYAKVKITEVADEATPNKASPKEEAAILQREADRIQDRIGSDRKVLVLAIEGDLVSSEDLAQKIENYRNYGNSKLTFIIGGSLGLSRDLKKKASESLSFGRITLPHQLMRLILLEQIYRSFRIIHGQAYHK